MIYPPCIAGLFAAWRFVIRFFIASALVRDREIPNAGGMR
jgi:hypothetical protein